MKCLTGSLQCHRSSLESGLFHYGRRPNKRLEKQESRQDYQHQTLAELSSVLSSFSSCSTLGTLTHSHSDRRADAGEPLTVPLQPGLSLTAPVITDVEFK